MKTKDENSFDKLISYFKYLVTITSGAITIIVGVSLYFTYNNLSDFRKEAKESANEYKETIKELNQYAQNAIDKTQENTNKQISLITIEAKQLALTAAKEKIDETFESKNINLLIEDAASRKLDKEIDLLVNKKLIEANKIIENQINIIPNLILSTDKMRWGSKEAYLYLDSIYQNNKDIRIKNLAKNIIDSKTKDYDNALKESQKETKNKKLYELVQYSELINKDLLQSPDKRVVIHEIINFIQKCNDLSDVSCAFEALRQMGIDIKTFDFEKLKTLK